MPKRRRERDRPKAGPESMYNPNKRVLLSYGSDDDESEDASTQQNTTTEPETESRNIANYQMTEYPESDDEIEGDAQPKVVGEPRLEAPDAAEDEVAAETEDIPTQSSGAWRNDARKDQSSNQFAAIGVVDGEYEEYDSTTEEAMAYLHAVRNERQAMPEVLSAPRQVSMPLDEGDENAEGDEGDEDYLVEDGTYIGRPDAQPAAAEDDALDPQRVFTSSLKDRFYTQRDQLRMAPSAEKVAALGEHHPISFPQGNSKAYAEWHRLLASKPPKTAQLQSLDQETVFNLLALLQKTYMVKGRNLRNVTSAWIWSLLARLDDVGNMTNDEVYPLRELGKKAIFLQLHFSNPEAAAGLEALQQDEVANADTDAGAEMSLDYRYDTDGDKVVRRSSSSHQGKTLTFHATASDNTLATLDMILVVVGEVFGQRDLLEFRQPWTKTAPLEDAIEA